MTEYTTRCRSPVQRMQELMTSHFCSKIKPVILELMSTNTFTFNRPGVNSVGQVISRELQKRDYSIELVPSDNPACGSHLFGVREGAVGETVLCLTHTDTVYPPETVFPTKEEKTILYGQGAADIHGGTGMFLLVQDTIQHRFPELLKYRWVVASNASEEFGSIQFIRNCYERLADNNVRACLAFEPSLAEDGMQSVVTARKGREHLRITMHGKAAHAGVSYWEGSNAIVALADVVCGLATLSSLSSHETVTVGQMHGGTTANTVPETATADVDVRGWEGTAHLVSRIREIVTQTAQQHACTPSIERISAVPNWPSNNENTKTLFSVWQSAADKLGVQLQAEERGGGSDASFFNREFPTLDGLGPRGGNLHCASREYVCLESYVEKAAINTLAIERLLGGTDRK